MFVSEKNKHNKFKLVHIPSNRDYFSRFGFAGVPDSFSGDQPGVDNRSKIDQIADMDLYDAYMMDQESKQ